MKHWVRTSFACSRATGLLFSSFCSFSKNSLKWDSFLFLWLWQSNEHPPAIWRFGVTNNEWTIFVFTFTWRLIPFTLFIRTTTSCPVDIRHKLWRFLFPPVPDGILSNSLTQLVTIVDSFVVLLHNGQWNDFIDFASTDDRQNETLTKRLWLWLDFTFQLTNDEFFGGGSLTFLWVFVPLHFWRRRQLLLTWNGLLTFWTGDHCDLT